MSHWSLYLAATNKLCFLLFFFTCIAFFSPYLAVHFEWQNLSWLLCYSVTVSYSPIIFFLWLNVSSFRTLKVISFLLPLPPCWSFPLLFLLDLSDCRVKLWNYVPGLTPCLPRRVLAIKGRATSLPWLPVLCSPTLHSSGTFLTNPLLLPASVYFPTFCFINPNPLTFFFCAPFCSLSCYVCCSALKENMTFFGGGGGDYSFMFHQGIK